MSIFADQDGVVITISDEAYDEATWNGSLNGATKNVLRDKFEDLTGSILPALVSDTAYGAGWNGVTTIAPSKNAVYDKIELVAADVATNTANISQLDTDKPDYDQAILFARFYY